MGKRNHAQESLRAALQPLKHKPLSRLTELLNLDVADRRRTSNHRDALFGLDDPSALLASLKHAELREICVALQLRGSGKKSELAARIVALWLPSTSPPKTKGKATLLPPKARKTKARETTKKSRTGTVDFRKRQRAEMRNLSRARTALGWDDISAEALEAFDADDFELLCDELVHIEVRDRHAASAQVNGPPAPFGRGEDQRILISEHPLQSRDDYQSQWEVESLTEDAIGTTVFSCKTGSTWRKTLMEEADHRSAWALQALQHGGRFTIAINVPQLHEQKETLKQTLARKYHQRMQRRNRPRLKDVTQRIRVIDANVLARFLRGRRPLVRRRFRETLGCGEIPALLSPVEWYASHERDRGDSELGSLAYERDEGRERAHDDLVEVMRLGSGKRTGVRVAWLIGAPGVGKTRLLIELLRAHRDIERRTLVAISPYDAVLALRDHKLFERFPRAVLIVDDCADRDIDRIAERLPGGEEGAAGSVIAITPRATELPVRNRISSVFSEGRVQLGPMARDAHERMIRQILSEPDKARDVAIVTEGYPWFATLVARERLGDDDSKLTLERAVRLALCSRDDGNWDEAVVRRARVLLLVILTEDTNWSELNQSQRENLHQAVGLDSWGEVDTTFRACVSRGLVRTRLGRTFKYVTPAILAREVLRMLLDPPPDGPQRVGPRLREHAREFLPSFYERLARFGLGDSVLAQLAEPIARSLESGAGITRAELEFAVRHHRNPARLALVLERVVAEIPLDMLRDNARVLDVLFYPIVWLAHRRGSFKRAESALFRLALTDRETSFHRATPHWAELFLIDFSQTYLPFAERFDVLRQRCTEDAGDTDGDDMDGAGYRGRLLALAGVSMALDPAEGGNWYPELDGAFAGVTSRQVLQARKDLWMLLLECMTDARPEVVARAGDIAMQRLPQVGPHDLDEAIVERLARLSPDLPEQVQRGLRRGVEDALDRFERIASHDPDRKNHLSRLKAALAPHTFSQRLRDHVGSYSVLHENEDEDEREARHRILIHEGLRPPGVPILAESRWLVSGEARQGVAFALTLGMEDRAGVMLAPLLEYIEESDAANIISAYILGWYRAGRTDDVRRVLHEHLHDESMSKLVTNILVRLGACDESIEMLITLLARNRFDDRLLNFFASGWPRRDASDRSLSRLVRALQERGSQPARELALTLLVRRVRHKRESLEIFRDDLRDLLYAVAHAQRQGERLEGGLAVRWQRGVKALMSIGADVAELLLEALSCGSPSIGKTPIWKAFDELAGREPARTWLALTEYFEQVGLRAARRLGPSIAQHRIVEHFARTEVMDWVGNQPEHAVWVASLINMHHSEALPELAHDLIGRFGKNTRCARVLTDSFISPKGMVGSLAEFIAEQMARARIWLKDGDRQVSEWAAMVLEEAEPRYQRHLAHEEHEQLRWSTSRKAAAGG